MLLGLLAITETKSGDYMLSVLHIDLRYRFLGQNGFVQPSKPDYFGDDRLTP